MNGKIFMMSSVIDFVDGVFRFLSEYCTASCDNPDLIHFPGEVIKWLQSTISKSGNRKPFIENCNGKLKWLQNTHNAWILLTHDNIRGNLSKNKAALQSSSLFINSKNLPLKNVRPDKRTANICTDDLLAFLNGLKNTTT